MAVEWLWNGYSLAVAVAVAVAGGPHLSALGDVHTVALCHH
ncbi:hypothetical protein FHU38_004007 [Saccharomonospora amisosensis]|uniref:Uncharacterized protein n=1 Tax=Saccharomonospora amisosensis TaxID=1128677 RepID=A0A7X5UTZ4_9PSEU|nr:hypothetical protein [Saccharomonospora amisosensis]NIJ13663.1 hypothetical protein [Saccharomonospora amisosensis]